MIRLVRKYIIIGILAIIAATGCDGTTGEIDLMQITIAACFSVRDTCSNDPNNWICGTPLGGLCNVGELTSDGVPEPQVCAPTAPIPANDSGYHPPLDTSYDCTNGSCQACSKGKGNCWVEDKEGMSCGFQYTRWVDTYNHSKGEIRDCGYCTGNKQTMELGYDTLPRDLIPGNVKSVTPATGGFLYETDTIRIVFDETMEPQYMIRGGDLNNYIGQLYWESTSMFNDTLIIKPSHKWRGRGTSLALTVSDASANIDNIIMGYYVRNYDDELNRAITSIQNKYDGNPAPHATSTAVQGPSRISNSWRFYALYGKDIAGNCCLSGIFYDDMLDRSFIAYGDIYQTYMSTGGPGGKLGWPMSDEYDCGKEAARCSDFENGKILWHHHLNVVVKYY